MEKIMKMFLVIVLAITCAIFPCTKVYAEEDSYLEEFKENYRNTSYYEYTPTDRNEYFLMDEDEVIEIFAGIKVTKRLLDENYILDIDRVTLNDLVATNGIQPYYLVPGLDDLGNSSYETYRIVPSGYQSVSVTKKGTILSGDYAGNTAYIVDLYLSNSALMYYIEDCLIGGDVTDAIESFVTEFVITTLVGSWNPIVGAGISIALGFLDAYNLSINQSFYTQLVTLRRAGKKAHVKVTYKSRSVTEWTNTVYAVVNTTINNIKIESEVIAYKDK